MGSLVKQCCTYNTFLLLLPLLQIRCQLPPSALTLHYFDESTHNSVQRLHPLRHVGREEPENDSVLVHQLLELTMRKACLTSILPHTSPNLKKEKNKISNRREKSPTNLIVISYILKQAKISYANGRVSVRIFYKNNLINPNPFLSPRFLQE